MQEHMEPEPVWLDAADGAGERLDRFLATRLPAYSRSRLQRWIALGAVTCETRALAAKSKIDRLGTNLHPSPSRWRADQAFQPEPVDFDIAYADDALLVVDKPAGLVVHPAPGNWHGTLMNGLLHDYESQRNLPRAGIVHRLDKDTSGLMVVARSEHVREALVNQLSQRTVGRRYLAVCHGRPKAFRAVGPIGRDPSNRLRMAVRPDGKPSSTYCQPLQTGEIDGKPVTLVRCQLETGRTHQIRVHLADAGYPLVGDVQYGGQPAGGFGRQALHAFSLELIHPGTSRDVGWQSLLPPDMALLVQLAGWSVPDAAAIASLRQLATPAANR